MRYLALFLASAALVAQSSATSVSCLTANDCPFGQGCNNGICGTCSEATQCRMAELCNVNTGICIQLCADGRDCNGGSRGCVPDEEFGHICSECTVDEHCSDGRKCNSTTGVCKCNADSQCQFTAQRCDLADGLCHEMQCSTADDCEKPWACAGGICGSCSGSQNCREGEKCLKEQGALLGKCAAASSCAVADDCPAGQGCSDGACGDCSDSKQCRPYENCVKKSGSLLGQCAPVTCTTANDCPQSDACNQGVCVGDCSDSTQCRKDERCLIKPNERLGKCAAASTCASASECPFGQACNDGVCGACTSATQCRMSEMCNVSSGHCFQMCTSDGNECDDGRGCISDEEFGHICGECTEDAHCSKGRRCDGGVCKCNADSQCALSYQQCHLEDGLCHDVACNVPDDCDQPHGCLSGTCGPCSAAQNCRKGEECVKELGALFGKCVAK